MTTLYDIENRLIEMNNLLKELVENTKPVVCPEPSKEQPESKVEEKLDFYKLQGGIYKMLNGDYAFVRGFGECSGWGINISTLSDIIYTWDTDTGNCIYRNGKTNLDRHYDLVEYVGTDLREVLDFKRE